MERQGEWNTCPYKCCENCPCNERHYNVDQPLYSCKGDNNNNDQAREYHYLNRPNQREEGCCCLETNNGLTQCNCKVGPSVFNQTRRPIENNNNAPEERLNVRNKLRERVFGWNWPHERYLNTRGWRRYGRTRCPQCQHYKCDCSGSVSLGDDNVVPQDHVNYYPRPYASDTLERRPATNWKLLQFQQSLKECLHKLLLTPCSSVTSMNNGLNLVEPATYQRQEKPNYSHHPNIHKQVKHSRNGYKRRNGESFRNRLAVNMKKRRFYQYGTKDNIVLPFGIAVDGGNGLETWVRLGPQQGLSLEETMLINGLESSGNDVSDDISNAKLLQCVQYILQSKEINKEVVDASDSECSDDFSIRDEDNVRTKSHLNYNSMLKHAKNLQALKQTVKPTIADKINAHIMEPISETLFFKSSDKRNHVTIHKPELNGEQRTELIDEKCYKTKQRNVGVMFPELPALIHDGLISTNTVGVQASAHLDSQPFRGNFAGTKELSSKMRQHFEMKEKLTQTSLGEQHLESFKYSINLPHTIRHHGTAIPDFGGWVNKATNVPSFTLPLHYQIRINKCTQTSDSKPNNTALRSLSLESVDPPAIINNESNPLSNSKLVNESNTNILPVHSNLTDIKDDMLQNPFANLDDVSDSTHNVPNNIMSAEAEAQKSTILVYPDLPDINGSSLSKYVTHNNVESNIKDNQVINDGALTAESHDLPNAMPKIQPPTKIKLKIRQPRLTKAVHSHSQQHQLKQQPIKPLLHQYEPQAADPQTENKDTENENEIIKSFESKKK